MGFAQKIAAAQNNQMADSGSYGGAPPSGYTGGPPAALQAGGSSQQQYQTYSGSPAPQGSNQSSYSRPPPSTPYPSSQPGYGRPPPPPPGQPYASASSPYPGQQPGQPYASPNSPYPGQNAQSPYPGQQQASPQAYPGQQQYGQQPYPGQQPSYNQGPPYPSQGAPYPGGQGRPGPSPGPPSGPPPGQYSAPSGPPPGQYSAPSGPPPGQYSAPSGPPPGQYGAPSGPPPGQYSAPSGPPPGQYGAPSGPPPGQYGAPGGGPQSGAPPATPQQVAAYHSLLSSTIEEKRLGSFYPKERLDRLVQTLAAEAPGKLNKLIHEWAVPMEVATDVMKLSLFDVILYVDDSGSIEFEEKGLRKEQLRQILGIVATAASTFDQDGISVRFMNSSEKGDGIRNAEDVERLVSRVRFSGLTPLGTSLRAKVIDPMVVQPARANRLEKPVLVITITDGQPAGEPHDTVGNTIRYAVGETSQTQYGPGSVSFQFSQVGTDQRARDFLSSLDEDPHIGHLIDCTSNFEVEQDEMSRANPPVHLTRELWCAKLMLGAIDSSYDTKDEKDDQRRGPQSTGQYGGGGYGQPQGQAQPPYGAPPGPPPNYGSQSGYPQGQYQQSPQQPPYQGSRGGYGQPQGYPSQPGSGYGQPRY